MVAVPAIHRHRAEDGSHHKCNRVRLPEEHEHEAELLDVKPLLVEEEDEGGHAAIGTTEGCERNVAYRPIAKPSILE